ncbi:hypothetical protein K501DRAFT_36144 [Backusella circina FSU 941]|nr:hypothetical protein K501DRAFT_36144 [Backusella circina FSU 941]
MLKKSSRMSFRLYVKTISKMIVKTDAAIVYWEILYGDPVLFGSKSVGTILKNAGEKESQRFWSLKKRQQHLIGLCLNSVLDLTGQKELFQQDEWRIISS